MAIDQERPLALVTGASSGIGYELAAELARRGFDLVVTAENPGIAEAAQAFEGMGAKVQKVQVDLTDSDGVLRLYREANASGRPIDAVVINAGVGVSGDFAKTELDAELKLIALNVTSSVHLAKLIIQNMAERGEGRVLFTSSIAALMPGPYSAVYSASKAFLLQFSEALRYELKDSGITVTALLPSATETDFFRRAGMEDTKVGAGKKDDPAVVAKQGVAALLSGQQKVVGGSFKNKIQAAATRVLPDAVKAKVHGDSAKPGSANK